MLKSLQSVTEDSIKTMTVEECLSLKRQLQYELQKFFETNPTLLQRHIQKLNERLFDINYTGGAINEAYEF